MENRIRNDARELGDCSLSIGKHFDWKETKLNYGVAVKDSLESWRVCVISNREDDYANSNKEDSNFASPYAGGST
jgi:hypothetical protein